MPYYRLFILIEGDDDERFFDKIIKPRFQNKYDLIRLWKYAKEPKKRVNNLLRSIKAMNADYIYVTDIDRKPCITAKKEEIQAKYSWKQEIDIDRIIVVIQEIESWYLAGLDTENSRKLRISSYENTDSITKEQFDGLIPKKFISRVDFMQEILKYFKIEIARQKNKSFNYFFHKHSL